MPCHFGAWAGLGHCYAHEGQLVDAVEAYERALEINPHLDGIRQAVAELRGGGKRRTHSLSTGSQQGERLPSSTSRQNAGMVAQAASYVSSGHVECVENPSINAQSNRARASFDLQQATGSNHSIDSGTACSDTPV